MAKSRAQIAYESWINNAKLDAETLAELVAIADDEVEIEDRFYQDLQFGTAGLRGIMGAGTNRMNRYTVARAAEGFASCGLCPCSPSRVASTEPSAALC